MGRVHVGLGGLAEDIGRYQSKFDMVEVRFDTAAMPRTQTLRTWRKEAGPTFVFSVAMPPVVSALAPSKELDVAFEQTLAAAVALEARALVLQTTSDVRPTQTNIKRLRSLFGRMPRPGVALCWEPQGIWERSEILGYAKEFEVLPVFDVSQEQLPTGSVVYTRLRALGGSDVGARVIERLVAGLRTRREAFVVVEHAPSAKRLRSELTRLLAQNGAAAGPQVRAVPGRLRAEDEEQ